MKPAVEVFHRAIILRFPLRDKDGLDADSQTQPNHPTEPVGRGTEATEFAAIITLEVFWKSLALPRLDQELYDRIHLVIFDEFHIDGLVKDVFVNQKIVASRTVLQIPRSHHIHLMDLIRVLSLRTGVFVPGDTGG